MSTPPKKHFADVTYMHVADVLLSAEEPAQQDGVAGVKVLHKLARHSVDLNAHVQTGPEALVLCASLRVKVVELGSVQLRGRTQIK